MMKKNFAHWIEKHRISFHEVDFSNELRIDSIFNYLQQAASNSANQLGWGYKDISKDNLAWVLYRIKLVISRFLNAGDEIMIETWPKGLEGISALREFRIFDENYEVIGCATSAWFLVDGVSMRPLRNPEIKNNMAKMEMDNESVISEIPGKIIIPEKKELIYERKIYYTDIDVNNHVNNVNFVRMILDSFDLSELSVHKIKSIQVNFLSEIKYGGKIKIFRCNSGDKIQTSYIEGIKSDNVKAFQSVVTRE